MSTDGSKSGEKKGQTSLTTRFYDDTKMGAKTDSFKLMAHQMGKKTKTAKSINEPITTIDQETHHRLKSMRH